MEISINSQKIIVLGDLLVRAGSDIESADTKLVATKVNEAFDHLEKEMSQKSLNHNRLVLTAKQIRELASFAESEGQESYTISYGIIPEHDDLPEYSGLIAYSGDTQSGVLTLGE
ncbi:hypothetical protein D3C81_31980 [compost metagenome]